MRVMKTEKLTIRQSVLLIGLFLFGFFLFGTSKVHAAEYDITPYSIPSGEQQAYYIASSADGNIWFVERQNNQLSKIDAITGEITEHAVPGIGADCGGLASGPSNSMWFIKGSTSKMGRWDIATNTETDFDLPDLGGGCYFGLIAGPDGNMWFAHESGKVGKITPSGTVTTYDAPDDGAGMQLTVGPDNNIWFSNPVANSLVKITTSGTTSSYPLPDGMSGGFGTVTGADDNIWVSTLDNKVARFNIGTEQFDVFDTPDGSYPMLLALGGDGNVWFGSAGGQGFGRISQSGAVTMFNLPDSETPVPIFTLATGSYGNIFGISNGQSSADSKVYKLELPGSQLRVLGANENCSQIQLISGSASTGIVDLKKLDKDDLPSNGNSYVTSLADYELTVPSGSTQRVRLVFQTCQPPEQVIARKYSNRTKKFTTIPGAQITQTSLNGNTALMLSYDIADGGPLDDDGVANGVIVDPVGLAQASDVDAAADNGTLVDTGQDVKLSIFTGTLLIASALALLRFSKRTVYKRN